MQRWNVIYYIIVCACMYVCVGGGGDYKLWGRVCITNVAYVTQHKRGEICESIAAATCV